MRAHNRRVAFPVVAGGAWVAVASVLWRDALSAHLIPIIIGVGLICVVPLGLLAASAGARPSRFRKLAELAALPGAAIASISLVLEPGIAAGLIAAAYLFPAAAIALWGVSRFLSRGPWPIEELAIDVGLVYLSVAAVWLVAGRLGHQPLGFVEPIVSLTAVHFTYAGFGVAMFAGCLGRSLAAGPTTPRVRRVYWIGAAGAIAAVPIVAVGIWVAPVVELGGAILLALCMLKLAGLGLTAAQAGLSSPLSRALVAAASTALLFTMVCAALYAAGEMRHDPILDVAQMVDLHGVVNAVAFAVAGLTGFALAAPPARYSGSRAPFSRLAGDGGVIGADYFDRIGAVVGADNPPRGLVDALEDYARPQLNPQFIDLAIRRFYERTGDYAISVVPRWRWFARPAAALFRRWSRRAGQLGLPFDPVADAEMNSRFVWLSAAADGRDHPRAWIRTYVETGDVVYAAAYATHVTAGVPYMNIAFPLPGGNMTSVLRVDFFGGGGLAITTRRPGGDHGDDHGDEGIFWVRGRRALRLPMNETIYVVARREAPELGLTRPPEGAGRATAVARHDLWVLGVKMLSLEYWLTPR
jgi:hypothetical protein